MQRILKDVGFANSEHRLIIKREVLNVFKKYEQRKGTNESGGILLGHVYKNRADIIEIATPNRFDSSGPLFFNRSKIGAQLQINKAWEKSNGTLIYLGEWHTHPEINPKPSAIDKEMIAKSLKEIMMEISFLYLIIVGRNNTYWVGKQMRKKLIKLERVHYDILY